MKSAWPTSGRGFATQTKLEYRDRKSCKCDKCNILADAFLNDLREGVVVTNWDFLKSGKYYHPIMTNISIDWETGYSEDWTWTMVEA